MDFPDVREDGVLRVPVTDADRVEVRFAPLLSRDRFDPKSWRTEALDPVPDATDWYQLDVDGLDLSDGRYEYEYVVHRGDDEPVVAADPFAEEITRFRGRRGTFRIRDGERFRPAFSWEDELPDAGLPENNELVVYELPLRWASPASSNDDRNVPDGDFESLLSEHLDELESLGVNAIELLPIQDAAVTLDWGYGTRFFFAPDLDFGGPVDAKFLVKECHKRGIRVLMDIVMNHARECPLETLAGDRFFLDPEEKPDRPDWGGRRFDFENAVDGYHPAREFLYSMADFWIREYHVDGFRIDEFKGMDHWEFVQKFRDRAWAAHRDEFSDRPFLVVAEDSWGRTEIVREEDGNPDGRKVVDAMWNFDFRDESRRLLRDEIETEPGEPSRSERIRALISGRRTWDDRDRAFEEGFTDLSQAVNYMTSHDMGERGEQRLMNYIFGELVRERGIGDGSIDNVRYLLDELVTAAPGVQIDAHGEAVDRVRGSFALLLTAVGIPMFLTGEEFGDVHDLDYTDWQLKMEDPVEWSRRDYPGHDALQSGVRDLIHLRTEAEALQRNEVEFFYAHPTIDEDDGVPAFAYCRTGGRELGSEGQVVVVANCGPDGFEAFDIPWPWTDTDRVEERGDPVRGTPPEFSPDEEGATLSLSPFQVRVFTT
ncbi:1,4-alpha-glucan branching enzyme [Halopelagius inordinatus]|uniref:1,4-alpha-glucan branching enzyme n=1 Tax=Halopelagius inordinatus TaxID=553467 RepID=A0A1I2MCD6_9EURY|nr:alpha-amylase family glycosyl hydrolase [Halopelagius inordinatus]SFF86901.1 1,4-alpha-glucan branching enzyme [Halopelagius inordinatus]